LVGWLSFYLDLHHGWLQQLLFFFVFLRRLHFTILMSNPQMRFLTATEAAEIDAQLMSDEHGFVLPQLMELAGLSCSQAIYHCYPPTSFSRVLVLCGPGNNGGDGLVCARHLAHFGYHLTVIYPTTPKTSLFQGLLKQVENMTNTRVIKHWNSDSVVDLNTFSLCVDAIFGFSFDAAKTIRPPYDHLIQLMVKSSTSVVSIDIPSGWHVEKGDVNQMGLMPEMLISLSAPKLCARYFAGKHHVLGGRFIPASLEQHLDLRLPSFSGDDQFVLLDHTKASL